MGSVPENDLRELSYVPTKISTLISRQSTSPEIPLPQRQTTISIPFKWEESPGKPRHCHTQSELENSTVSVRTTLDLPPRLLFSKIDAPSPTTVLDGPYIMGRALSFTSSYRTPRDAWNSNFGSSRWRGLKKINRERDEGSFDFSGHCNTKSNNKVKIIRASGGGSLLSLSKGKKSHLWASIYESFKQVVPWRCRKETQIKWPSKTDTV